MHYILNEKLSSTIVVYMIIKRIIRPWKDWNAYKTGLIDAKGKRLKKAKTTKERESFDVLDRFCWNIKRICTKYLSDSTFAYLFSAAYLLKEDCNIIFKNSQDKYINELENFTAQNQLDIYKCIQKLESDNILREENLDFETNLIKISKKIEPYIPKFLKEDGEIAAGSSTSLGDIAQFTPVLGTLNRRRFRSRKYKINKIKEKTNVRNN